MSIWIGPPTASSGGHCGIGWFLRVQEVNRSIHRHMRMKQRPTSPLTGLKFGFSGKKSAAGSATFASWTDETAVLDAVRRGKGDASPSGGNAVAVEETADIGTPKCHSGRVLRCKLLLLRCRTAAQVWKTFSLQSRNTATDGLSGGANLAREVQPLSGSGNSLYSSAQP